MLSWDVHPRLWSKRERTRSESSRRATALLALVLAAAVYAARYVDDDIVVMPLLLLGVPVALCGVWFGFKGGVSLRPPRSTTIPGTAGEVDAGRAARS